MPQTDDARDEEVTSPSFDGLLRETLLVTILMVGGVAVAGYLFRAPLEQTARWLVDTLGYAGLFGGIFVADAFTVPIPPDTYLFLSIASQTTQALANPPIETLVTTLVVCSAASVIGGNIAYWLGPYIEQIPILQDKLEEYRPEGEKLFGEWGSLAVAIAALTPVPFSIVSWLAGIYRMKYSAYFAASLARIPRIVGYYALYYVGWAPSL
jgi:membrane protein YqaA with SNARE-associated domain